MAMSQQLSAVEQEVELTRSELQQLIGAFAAYVDEDRRMNQLQLAETRIVKVRQQIEKEYGHYDQVRRHALGILQAADVQLVRRETMKTASEELMLSAPRYWLAPALVALAAWIHDDPQLANRAVAEALRRHASKTCLFFALVCRRAGRYQASTAWLEHYFSLQSPTALEREAVVLVDAVTNGAFGVDARTRSQTVFQEWLEILAEQPGFVRQQQADWTAAFQSYVRQVQTDTFPYLARYSPTWPELQAVLSQARVHEEILSTYQQLFEGPVEAAPTLVEQVDALLEKLVSHFDEEERPLRRQERHLQLIIDCNGDVDGATARLQQEEASFQKTVHFGELLTQASFHPQSSHASLATRRFSIALSREWAKQAHANLTASYRAKCPRTVDIQIKNWKGQTTDGTNEEELIQSIHRHLDEVLAQQLRQNRPKFWDWTLLVLGGGGLASSADAGLLAAIGGGAFLLLFLLRFVGRRQRRKQLLQNIEKARAEYEHALRAVLADVVEYRRAYEAADAQAERVTEFLASLSSEDFVYSGFDPHRLVLTS